ncbi:MAG: ABC transporter ATP-binding protein [Candidatus Sulfobium sp.]
MIIIDGVSKSFNGFHAVKDFSLAVGPGEIFGLVGPNGAGKTTTIKMMTGLLSPDKGKILLVNHDIVSEPTKAKSVLGYVPDKAFLYEKLTLKEFMFFVSAIHNVSRSGALSRIESLFDTFGIRDMEDELIEGLSRGLRQRLVFCAALVHDPKVLLIDEPFTGLDAFGVRTLGEIMGRLSLKGVSVLLATHSLHLAEDLCHRIGFIRGGTLVSINEKEEIKGMEGGLEGLFMRLGR